MKEKLKQIRFISTEISAIESQINDLKPITSADKVMGSSPSFPYTAMSFHINGVDIEDYNRRTKQLKNKLIKKKSELLTLQEEAQNFIDKIEDSLTRQIITLRFVNCLSWNEIAEEVGRGSSTDSVRKISERFLKNI
jgi:DNA-directed RNA polymerase specialized sigma subunit